MVALETSFLLVLLVISSFAPGFFIVRRLPWSPGEKLCGSIGLSLALVYLASLGIYCFVPGGGPIGAVPYAAVTLISTGLALASWRDIVRLFQTPRVRRMATGYAFLLGWTLLLLSIIRNYAGAGWSRDWLEHFQRSLFFIDRFPVNTEIIPGYILPARPPLMNVVAGFFLVQTRDSFENYQVIFCFLNLLLFLPCCLMLPRLAGPRRTRILPLVALFAASPVVMEDVTYTWTKAFAAFYIVLAIYCYLTGWNKRDPIRILAAFLAISAGMLAHYSAGPYLVFLTLHYLAFVFWKRPRKWREVAIIGASCTLFLATWFGWSLANYGFQGTFESNTSVISSRQYQGNNLNKISGNLYDSIVPTVLRDPALFDEFQQPTLAGKIRDAFFISYQTNVLLNMGILGGPLVIWLLVNSLRRPPGTRTERNFWLELVPFSVVVGIASAGERDPFGLAHLTLLPMAALGLTLLASAFPWGRIMTVLVMVGCLVDFSMGVFLQVHLESLENTSDRTVFAGVEFDDAGGQVGKPGPDSLSTDAWNNWVAKHKMMVAQEWSAAIEHHVQGDAQLQARWGGILKRLQEWIAEDGVYWHGWYARHGGSVTFLGDDIGGSCGVCTAVIEGVLLLVMLGLMAAVARESWNVPISASTPQRGPKRPSPSRTPVSARGPRSVDRRKGQRSVQRHK
jgi:hypothetical protein